MKAWRQPTNVLLLALFLSWTALPQSCNKQRQGSLDWPLLVLPICSGWRPRQGACKAGGRKVRKGKRKEPH